MLFKYDSNPVLGPKLAYIQNAAAIKGTSILALAARQFDDPVTLLEIKRLMRMVFNHHLGNRQIKTRELNSILRSPTRHSHQEVRAVEYL